jgi:hypothetical protein
MQRLDAANADLYRASENVQEARSLVISAMQTPQGSWVCTITYGKDFKGYGNTEDDARNAALDSCAQTHPMNQCVLFKNHKNYSECHMTPN